MPKRYSPTIQELLKRIAKLEAENKAYRADKKFLDSTRDYLLSQQLSMINSNIREEIARSAWKPNENF